MKCKHIRICLLGVFYIKFIQLDSLAYTIYEKEGE